MKKIIKFSEEYIKHLPDEIQEDLDKLFDGTEEELCLKRIINSDKFCINEEDERTVVGYISTRTIDRDNEIVLPKGIDYSAYLKNPVILWNHNWSGMPIGSNKEIKADDYGLIAKSKLADTEDAINIWKLIKDGHLKASSIGFVPTKSVKQGEKGFGEIVDKMIGTYPEFTKDTADKCSRFITKSVLLEHSFVTIPSNPEALTVNISEKAMIEPKVEEVKNKIEEAKLVVRLIRPPVKRLSEVEIAELIQKRIELSRGRI